MSLNKTALYQDCLEQGARMVPFAGWEMPLQFSGLVKEHKAVREKAGVFDISHMGVLRLEGKNPKDALQQLVPTDLHRIGKGEACYTVLTNEAGGIIDDLIIYDLEDENSEYESLLLILNASCHTKDIHWLKKHLEPKNIYLKDAKINQVLLALQGPSSCELLEEFQCQSLKSLPRFGHKQIKLEGLGLKDSESIFISRTGYTGEEGYEMLLPASAGKVFWTQLLSKGVIPCGLGARDTLRLEASMHLYGQDMNEKTTPFEAGLGWLVHLEMPAQFIGRSALEKKAKEGSRSRLIGLEIEDRAIARHGNPIMHKGEKIGAITSGSWSPTLEKPIAMGYIPTSLGKLGSTLEVEIRSKTYAAKVVKRPFYRRS